MKEIKFRAWYKIEKEMFVVSKISFLNQPTTFPYASLFNKKGFLEVNLEMIELMQYTGLKDRSGKEIYEGDIVRWGDIANYCIRYDEEWASFIGLHVDGSRGWLKLDKSDTYTIIGNIYENPELLKPETS